MTRPIIHVITGLGTGGAEGMLVRLAVGLQARGIPQHVVSLANRDFYADVLEAHDIGVTTLRVKTVTSALRGLIKLVGIIGRLSPMAIQGWMYHGNLFGLVAHKLAPRTEPRVLLWSLRASDMDAKRYGRVLRWSARLSHFPDLIIANSESGVAFHKDCGFKAPMVVINNGIDSEIFRPNATARRQVRQELGIPLDAPVVIHAARVDPMKDHQSLLEAMAKIPAITAMLVGSDTDRLEAPTNVKGLGLQRDMPRHYAAADIVVSSSAFGEGFSNVIAEGMSAGLVPIATDVGDARRIVGDTGCIVPPANPCALAAAIAQECASPDDLKAKGLRARDRIVGFSIDRCVTAHIELYEELIAKDVVNRNCVKAPPVGATAYVRRAKSPLMFAYWGRHGALPQLTLELAYACQRARSGVDASISISTSNELFDRYAVMGDRIFPVVTYPSARAAANFRAALRLRRRLKERILADGTRAFVTLMSHVWSPLIPPLLKEAGVRHIVIVHDADPHLGDRTAMLNRWLLREATSADQVVTLTEEVARRLIEKRIVPAKKISVLFHPDLTYGSTPSLDDGPLRVLFLGRILPYKGLALFVEAMELLKESGIPIKIGVFGAGPIGPEKGRLARLGAEVINRWIHPDHFADILGRHDIVVVSHTEASQSGVIATAHGAGLPVIATPVGGLREQVVSEVTGIVTRTTTAKAVADAVRRLAEDRDLLLRLQHGIVATKRSRSMDQFLLSLSDLALGGGQEIPRS